MRELKEKLADVDISSVPEETYPRKKGALKKFVEELMDSDAKVVPRGLNRDIIVKGGKAGIPRLIHACPVVPSGSRGVRIRVMHASAVQPASCRDTLQGSGQKTLSALLQ